ncbi:MULTISPECIES: spore coat protein U domain-containing protein [Ramlibacter]|uniref:Spore coat protein U/FanG domain-containing protein n=1 Tax=Ramlibacter pinisoli TaxID=2682844 RepID=A0A6N8ITK8_9BURK|nr:MULTISPECIES: spore coat protein U domain-containing protein [Ramlibacter]MBA2965315.1 hypothetical protein [Ramlibacter sp. CGMCC 1.13660]MVQ30279.1 hypothetical protein [Ramlibacter pinisoli]
MALIVLMGSTAALGQSTATKNLTLSATLSSQCRVAAASSGAINVAFGTYAAFSPSAVTASAVTINFECTRNLGATPSFGWDALGGATSGEGVLAGLRYALTATNGTRTNGAAPVLGTAGDIGTPDTYPVTVNASMPAGQAGTGPSGAASATRTLTVTF